MSTSRWWLAVCIPATLLVVSCGSDSAASPRALTGVPSCAGTSNVLKLTGRLDAQPVEITQTPATGGYSQIGSGQFDTGEAIQLGDAGAAPAPTTVVMHLDWGANVAAGDSAVGSGTFTLPAPAPRAGQAIRAGQGTMIGFPATGMELEFVLRGFTLASDAATSIPGEIAGCWNGS